MRRRKCGHCGRGFVNFQRFNDHSTACSAVQAPKLRKVFQREFKLRRSAFKNFLVEYHLTNASCKDITWMFGKKGQIISDLLRYLLSALGAIKTQMCLAMHFTKHLPSGSSSEKFFTCTQMKTLIDFGDIPELLLDWHRELDEKLDQFVQRGSGWQLHMVNQIEVRAGKYVPSVGGCFVDLPEWITKKKATLNFNVPEDCFMFCILAGLHLPSKHRERLTQYLSFIDKYDFTDVHGIVSIEDIAKFEKKNGVSVNVYTLNFNAHVNKVKRAQNSIFSDDEEEDEEDMCHTNQMNRTIVPLKVNKNQMDKHVDLLLIDEHYVLIVNLNRLLGLMGDPTNKFCKNCLTGFRSQDTLDKHKQNCYINQPQRVVFPTNPIKFENYKKQLKCPIVIYADFEALIEKLDENDTGLVQKHVPCSYMWVAVDWTGEVIHYERKTCENAAERMLYSLKKEYETLRQHIVDNIKPMPLIDDHEDWSLQSLCHICQEHISFLDWQSRHHDHDHLTGEYRGIAHRQCNMKYQLTLKIPVVFHNLKNYDGHLLISAIQKDMFKKVEVMAQTLEKYISIAMDKYIVYFP